jgi:hypothetical protein
MKIDSWEFKDQTSMTVRMLFSTLDLIQASPEHVKRIKEKYNMGPADLKKTIEKQIEFLNENRQSGPKFGLEMDFKKLQEVYARVSEHFLSQIGK